MRLHTQIFLPSSSGHRLSRAALILPSYLWWWPKICGWPRVHLQPIPAVASAGSESWRARVIDDRLVYACTGQCSCLLNLVQLAVPPTNWAHLLNFMLLHQSERIGSLACSDNEINERITRSFINKKETAPCIILRKKNPNASRASFLARHLSLLHTVSFFRSVSAHYLLSWKIRSNINCEWYLRHVTV